MGEGKVFRGNGISQHKLKFSSIEFSCEPRRGYTWHNSCHRLPISSLLLSFGYSYSASTFIVTQNTSCATNTFLVSIPGFSNVVAKYTSCATYASLASMLHFQNTSCVTYSCVSTTPQYNNNCNISTIQQHGKVKQIKSIISTLNQ
ncbi:MAG: hypothetical protein LBQ31_09275 [Bacteroidales bacterium]|nr:hypothetical protein [Bacteroidales bacterium]